MRENTSPDKALDGSALRVAVALSGGVDSAVAAALYKERGADVFALTMRLQDDDNTDDAARVAAALGIPHHIIDLRDLFASCVMDYFADSYLDGETPVPCVRCNRLIKFGALMDAAKEMGAQALVTGHYARRVETPEGAQLHTGDDPARDQSYFLSALTQAQIDFLRFPLAEMTKDDTRAIAASLGLSVAQKPDSQDICFVPCGDYASVLQRLRPEAFTRGNIVDEAGNILGTHDGIAHFTVGQRKGLNLSARKGDNNAPLFVLALDAAKNQVIVGPREALAKRIVTLTDLNWLGGDVPAGGLPVTVKLRSMQAPVAATFHKLDDGKSGEIHLSEPVFGVAAGQAGVMYDGTHLLGGGRIVGAR
ncbi:MAG TPA: tRNA 2-thiouridine(34) synthase MnmA [Rhodospirillaceae bacterium]|nr:tRNA 2-thiouridine(34) synthase MnmA [Rhodospirillaceae bacterium]